jgi:ATP-binding cassette subfamily B protein
LRAAYAEGRVVLSQGTGYLQECLNGIKTVQLYNAETEVRTKYDDYTQGFYHAQSRSNFYDSALFAIIEGLTTIAMALIIWMGAREILDASITFGVLIGFTQTLDRIFVPVRDFTSQIASIQRALAAFGHIEEIYQQPLQESPTPIESHVDPVARFESLVFDDVRFRYSPQSPWVLNGVSFRLERGQQIALVGSTGSGKSTILRLLTRTYDDYQGSIRLNGTELRDLRIDQVARFFTLMQQEVFLFNQSLGFNISLGRDGIDAQRVEDAARYVYAHDFISKLPGGYQFELRGNGANLSTGQCQLLAFARAIASGSDVVLLDEATSAVDSVTEALIQKAIDHVFEDKTVIAIAHRLSTSRHSDQILVLESGRIIERGSHTELLAMSGLYAGLLKELEHPEG